MSHDPFRGFMHLTTNTSLILPTGFCDAVGGNVYHSHCPPGYDNSAPAVVCLLTNSVSYYDPAVPPDPPTFTGAFLTMSSLECYCFGGSDSLLDAYDLASLLRIRLYPLTAGGISVPAYSMELLAMFDLNVKHTTVSPSRDYYRASDFVARGWPFFLLSCRIITRDL